MAWIRVCFLIFIVSPCVQIVAAQSDGPVFPSGTILELNTTSSTTDSSSPATPTSTIKTDTVNNNNGAGSETGDNTGAGPNAGLNQGAGQSDGNVESETTPALVKTKEDTEGAGLVDDTSMGAVGVNKTTESGTSGSNTTTGPDVTLEGSSTSELDVEVSSPTGLSLQDTSSKDTITSSVTEKKVVDTDRDTDRDTDTGTMGRSEVTTTESPEGRADRELLYITIAICSGAVVLVFSVAVITYFTHRELPARVDIRKYASYTSV